MGFERLSAKLVKSTIKKVKSKKVKQKQLKNEIKKSEKIESNGLSRIRVVYDVSESCPSWL